MTIQMWINNPMILLNNEYIFELWPSTNMCYEQKMNAISRLIILFTILGYVLTFSLRILIIGILTLAIIIFLYKLKKPKLTKDTLLENFQNYSTLGKTHSTDNELITNPETLQTIIKSEFKEGNKTNPFSNVLLTEIQDDPERKAAPPSFNPNVEENITKNVKKTVQMLNPGINNTNKQLYSSLWDNFELDQSNRVFYSTANTRVANDQGAFAQFLYNDLKYSAKEDTPEGAVARVQDNYRYTLY